MTKNWSVPSRMKFLKVVCYEEKGKKLCREEGKFFCGQGNGRWHHSKKHQNCFSDPKFLWFSQVQNCPYTRDPVQVKTGRELSPKPDFMPKGMEISQEELIL